MQPSPFVGLPREARAPRLHLTAGMRGEVDDGVRGIGDLLWRRRQRVGLGGQALL